MAQKPPAFQFYVKEYLTSKGVIAMTPAQRGYYVHLLCHAWDSDRQGYLPNDPSLLWKLAGAESREAFEKDAELVLTQFKTVGDSLINERLADERRKQKAYSDKQKRSGIAGAKVRWGKKLHGTPIVSPMAKNSSASAFAFASASASAKSNTTTTSKPLSDAGLPSIFTDLGISLSLWVDFKKMREKIHRPVANGAHDLIAKELLDMKSKGENPVAVLEQAIVTSSFKLYPVGKGERHARYGTSGLSDTEQDKITEQTIRNSPRHHR